MNQVGAQEVIQVEDLFDRIRIFSQELPPIRAWQQPAMNRRRLPYPILYDKDIVNRPFCQFTAFIEE